MVNVERCVLYYVCVCVRVCGCGCLCVGDINRPDVILVLETLGRELNP